MRPLRQQRIILVGGSKGLGDSLKQTLLAAGHQVVSLSRTSGCHCLDLTWDENRIRAAIRAAVSILGGLDSLVITAGMGAYKWPTISDADVKALFQVNVFGPQAVFRACQRPLLRSRGKALFVTSTAARRPGSGGLAYYAGAKGAVHSWVISEGRRQIKHGVALCAVAPGFFDSPMTEGMAPALRAKTERAIPAGRYGKDYEVASFINDLLWQSNWVLAGQIYEASGGA